MLEVDEIPKDLKNRLDRMQELVYKHKPNGFIKSVHVVAVIMMYWQLEIENKHGHEGK